MRIGGTARAKQSLFLPVIWVSAAGLFAINVLKGHQFCPALLLTYRAARRSSACARSSGRPVTRITLVRAVWPTSSERVDLGRPSALASRAMTAALAAPLSGGAVTRSFRAQE